MSTGENINANGAPLTADMVRGGFHKFPQSILALVAPDVWPQILPLEIAAAYPFSAEESDVVPSGEVWFVDKTFAQLGRIVNVSIAS